MVYGGEYVANVQEQGAVAPIRYRGQERSHPRLISPYLAEAAEVIEFQTLVGGCRALPTAPIFCFTPLRLIL